MDILNDSLPGWSRRKYLKDTIGLIQEEKHFLKHELTKIFGDQMKIFPSEANFFVAENTNSTVQIIAGKRNSDPKLRKLYRTGTGLLQNCRKRSSGKCTTD